MLEEVKSGAAFVGAVLILTFAQPARAGIEDWNLSPAHADVGGWLGLLGGEAGASAYISHQPGGLGRIGVTGAGRLNGRLEKIFDNGWTLALHASFEVWHDRLSGDNYGDDVFQKVYVSLLTRYGRFELGQQDGAAYRMAITGPLVADAPAIDDANMTFFRAPDGGAFTGFFDVRTGVFASRNFAKISYYTPRVSGIELGASYTPHMAKNVLPFISAGADVANRQQNFLEAAANYERHFGALGLRGYAGLALAHNAARQAGHGNLYDGAVGGEADYDFGEQTLALGGAYHQSNGYGFDPGDAFSRGQTHAVHVSARLTDGPWIFGLEYSDGIAGREGTRPRLDAEGYEAALGYVVNSNLQVTAGFQQRDDRRSSGAFYNGKARIRMDAGFLYFYFHV
jgi:Gram-negative porin